MSLFKKLKKQVETQVAADLAMELPDEDNEVRKR